MYLAKQGNFDMSYFTNVVVGDLFGPEWHHYLRGCHGNSSLVPDHLLSITNFIDLPLLKKIKLSKKP